MYQEDPTGIIPVVVENKNGQSYSFDIYSRMLRERIIFLDRQFDDGLASTIIMQLLLLQHENKTKTIDIYVNSPGGVVTAGLGIIDTIRTLSCPVRITAFGQACSMGAMLLCSGAKGMRRILPSTRVMFHQPSGGARGMASDIQIQAREILHLKRFLNDMVVGNTGRTLEEVEKVMDRDTFMSAEETVAFGAADEVISWTDVYPAFPQVTRGNI